MNCDQAFDCLTDSGLRHSPQLEEHLAHCERCRQMQDTLEPALDLFDELIPEPDLSSRGGASTIAQEPVRIAEQAAARLLAANPKPPARRRASTVRYAAAAMVGAFLMGLMGTMNNVVAPVENTSPCVFQSRQINRQAYPTSNAVVRHCMECHQALHPTDFGVEAQPISIEAPADVAETADLIVRILRGRDPQELAISEWMRTARGDSRLCVSTAATALVRPTA